MIDLHCHILPSLDDGSPSMETSLEMARIAVNDGITTMACTPHVYPGVYNNTADGILSAICDFQEGLTRENIPLRLVAGADAHLSSELLAKLRSGEIPTLAASRYFLLEPPHHIAPPRFSEFIFNLQASGFVPVITHPERLSWIENHYQDICALVHSGAWMQVTAGSLLGRFGARPKYWSERMLAEGIVHILASDSHGIEKRPPLLAEGREIASRQIGEEESWHLVRTRPAGIIENLAPSAQPPLPAPHSITTSFNNKPAGGFFKWFSKRRNR